jgi:putative transcriptional regulator
MKRQRLADLRDYHNLSQGKMAELLNISRSYYGHIENGIRNPSFGLARRISEILGEPIDAIFLDLDCFRMKQRAEDELAATAESADEG